MAMFMKTKLISLLLAVVMVAGMIPFTALSVFAEEQIVFAPIYLKPVDENGDPINTDFYGGMDVMCIETNQWVGSKDLGYGSFDYKVGTNTLSGFDYMPFGYKKPADDILLDVSADGSVAVTSGNASVENSDGRVYIVIPLESEEVEPIELTDSLVNFYVNGNAESSNYVDDSWTPVLGSDGNYGFFYVILNRGDKLSFELSEECNVIALEGLDDNVLQESSADYGEFVIDQPGEYRFCTSEEVTAKVFVEEAPLILPERAVIINDDIAYPVSYDGQIAYFSNSEKSWYPVWNDSEYEYSYFTLDLEKGDAVYYQFEGITGFFGMYDGTNSVYGPSLSSGILEIVQSGRYTFCSDNNEGLKAAVVKAIPDGAEVVTAEDAAAYSCGGNTASFDDVSWTPVEDEDGNYSFFKINLKQGDIFYFTLSDITSNAVLYDYKAGIHFNHRNLKSGSRIVETDAEYIFYTEDDVDAIVSLEKINADISSSVPEDADEITDALADKYSYGGNTSSYNENDGWTGVAGKYNKYYQFTLDFMRGDIVYFELSGACKNIGLYDKDADVDFYNETDAPFTSGAVVIGKDGSYSFYTDEDVVVKAYVYADIFPDYDIPANAVEITDENAEIFCNENGEYAQYRSSRGWTPVVDSDGDYSSFTIELYAGDKVYYLLSESSEDLGLYNWDTEEGYYASGTDSGVFLIYEPGEYSFYTYENLFVKAYLVRQPKANAVYIAGSAVTSGQYYSNDGEITTEKPDGGYAYYNNGVLILEDFECRYDSYSGEFDVDVYEEGSVISTMPGEDLTVILKGDNNLVNDGEGNGIKAWEGSLTIGGDGTIEITADDDCLDADVLLTIDGGSYNLVSTGSDAVYSDGGVVIKDGNITIEHADDDAFEVSDDIVIDGGTIKVLFADDDGLDAGGDIIINDCELIDISSDDKGITSERTVEINGGVINVASNTDYALCADEEIIISDSEITAVDTEYGIRSYNTYGSGDITVTNSDIEVKTRNGNLAFKADGDITFNGVGFEDPATYEIKTFVDEDGDEYTTVCDSNGNALTRMTAGKDASSAADEEEKDNGFKLFLPVFMRYNITYHANNGDRTDTANGGSYPLNTVINAAENTFANDGKEFAGWNTKADGSGTAYPAGAKITVNQHFHLYAQWK